VVIGHNDGYTVWTRPWRTQIHVISVDYGPAEFWFEIPGWESDEVIKRSLDILPWKIRLQIHQDFRCHARVNLGADTSADLTFTDWEAS
jgi:hypothetical protein